MEIRTAFRSQEIICLSLLTIHSEGRQKKESNLKPIQWKKNELLCSETMKIETFILRLCDKNIFMYSTIDIYLHQILAQ